MNELLRLAIDGILAGRLKAGLSMLGVIIGVVSVIVLVSIGNGSKIYVNEQFESLGTNLIIVQPGKTDSRSAFSPLIGNTKRRLTLGDLGALERHAFHLEAVTGLMYGTASVKYDSNIANVTVMGTNEKFPQIINIKVGKGGYLTKEDENGGRRVVVLGYNVVRTLFGELDSLDQLVKINQSEFRVIGLNQKAGDFLGFNLDDTVFIPTRAAMRLFNSDGLFGIRAKAKSKAAILEAVNEIHDILLERHNWEDDFSVITQATMLKGLNSVLNILTYALLAISCVSIVIGGIGIMNVMLVNVTERTREIGIRRAVGATRSDILYQFLFEALILSMLGGTIGIAISYGVAVVANQFLSDFKMITPLWAIPVAFALSFIAGVGFGVWPALKAAHLQTVDALRHE